MLSVLTNLWVSNAWYWSFNIKVFFFKKNIKQNIGLCKCIREKYAFLLKRNTYLQHIEYFLHYSKSACKIQFLPVKIRSAVTL